MARAGGDEVSQTLITQHTTETTGKGVNTHKHVEARKPTGIARKNDLGGRGRRNMFFLWVNGQGWVYVTYVKYVLEGDAVSVCVSVCVCVLCVCVCVCACVCICVCVCVCACM